jgi:hypothetical protein
MRYKMWLSLATLIVSLVSGTAVAQSIKAIKVTFATTSDDKDWNTQVRDRIVLNGQDVATLFCCSADHNGDHWPDHGTTSAPMQIVNSVSKNDLHSATFVAGMTAVGHDTWIFIPTVTVTYSDGTEEQWTFPETTLSSNNSYEHHDYSMAK